MLDIRELIRRVQLGEADRQIARDLQVSRKTVSKYRTWAQQQGLASGPLPDAASLQAQLTTTLPVSPPPAVPSKVAPFRDQVIALRQRGVECRAIFDILREQTPLRAATDRCTGSSGTSSHGPRTRACAWNGILATIMVSAALW